MVNLVIVESPNKIKLLSSILGKDYKVIASCGHIMDLNKSKLSIDINNNFKPTYCEIDTKKSVIQNIKKEAKGIKNILVAGDIDFEGTFINWSIKKILKLKNPRTLEFIALTKKDVIEALKKETYINKFHLKAQKTRRILDRLCGFLISPELIKIFKMINISAGRVQSVVTKLIVEKEKDIIEFLNGDNKSYYNIKGTFDFKNPTIKNINSIYSNKIKSQSENEDILEKISDTTFNIINIENKEVINKSPKPFNTPTIQQTANIRYGYSAAKTMQVLQSLFTKGYITYIRTTSIQLSDECLNLTEKYILENYEDKYFNKTIYKDKKENSENSHEAIRYTSNENTPEFLKSLLSDDELKIYTLIFNTTLASQMKPQKITQTKIYIKPKNLDDCFVSTINTTKFEGYKILFKNLEEDEDETKLSREKIDKITLKTIPTYNIITSKEVYNNPPTRYSEASLINKLDVKNLNIGRPSTYASIITKIQERNYVKKQDVQGLKKTINTYELNKDKENIETSDEIIYIGQEKNKFVPTELGITITEFLNKYFSDIMDYTFTAKMEKNLDLIAKGELSRVDCLKEFYNVFEKNLKNVKSSNVQNEFKNKNTRILGIHPETKQEISATLARYGWVVKMKKEDKFVYAPIREPLTPETITLNDAIILFEYPKNLGNYKDIQVILNKGRFSLYLTYGSEKISVTENNINLKDAIELIKINKEKYLLVIENKDYIYKILDGKFGKYINVNPTKKTLKKFNVKLPKEYDENDKYKTLTIDQIKEIINNKPKTKFRKFKKK
jgi:DNA topoisomerase-1